MDAAGRGHRRVAEADHRLLELRVAAGADGVDLVVEPDQVVVGDAVVAELEDPELGEAVAALVHHEVAGEGVDVLEPDRRVVGDQRLPVGPRGRPGRGPGQLEVGAVAVVHDQELVLAGDDRVLEVVLEVGLALGEDDELAGPVLGGASASRMRYSLVVLEPETITRNRSLRVRPTPSQ